ncbi:MAG: SDR family NAD(P)-dependent oxidoreductase [Candidatus Melainabacteria bacterium]|nr:SDR family NAD(P)-dependent oxidoreductase [Candidatus Melainabacteria bacterium]
MAALRFVVLAPSKTFGTAHKPALAIAAAKAGALGVLDLEGSATENISQSINLCFKAAPRADFGIRCRVGELGFYLDDLSPELELGLVILCAGPNGYQKKELKDAIAKAQSKASLVAVEAVSLEEALMAEANKCNIVILKGNESPGRVSQTTSFVLLQEAMSKLNLPVWVRGGVGRHTARALSVAGVAGCVLDNQLYMARDSFVDEAHKRFIAQMDGTESEEICDSVGEIQRGVPGKNGELLALGQDASFASSLSRDGVSVAGIIQILAQASNLDNSEVLRSDSPLAKAHKTTYPIVQGAMTRVSDNADFALCVAKEGALPFLALSLMRGAEVEALLASTKKKCGDLSWGVGILGFAPTQLREEQTASILKHKPPFALIAGGRPDQAKHFEDNGITTYLHVPSPAILSSFLEAGAKHFVFEGRECGGHVGPRSSFVLWEQMIDVLLNALSNARNAAEYQILFAGGIHDDLSAAMTCAMAAPLTKLGVKVGFLLGTAYLFTREAVSSGAIVERFQKEAIKCDKTVILQSGPGHAIRCIESPYKDEFEKRKQDMHDAKRPSQEVKEQLEMMHMGRLRIASKGITRDGSQLANVDERRQWTEGMYMIGQVASMHDKVLSIKELHQKVSDGGADLLSESCASIKENVIVERPASEPVAIVGMSCFLPEANDIETFWSNILNRVDTIKEVPSSHFEWRELYDPNPFAPEKAVSKWGGFLGEVVFDAAAYGIPPNSLASIDPMQLLTLECVRHALSDAGYDKRRFAREQTSVIVANAGHGPMGSLYLTRTMLSWKLAFLDEETKQYIYSQLPDWSEDALAGYLGNVAAGRVSNRFDLGGINFSIDAACASSLAALHSAMATLRTRESDMVILGSVDTHNQPIDYVNFSKTHALSPRGRCRTFDSTADGIVLGEGIGVVLLKRLADAERDGDKIYAVIKGIGGSSDGKDLSLTAPRPAGQMQAINRAYKDAGISPSSVGLVEAHGTGTVAGDKAEVEALSKVYRAQGAPNGNCAIGSVKSNIGHTKCTAGLASLIKITKALYHKVLPPTIGVERPNPACKFESSPFYINSQTRPWIHSADSPRRAALSAFGFGGTNFHAVLEEYVPSLTPSNNFALNSWTAELFVFAADSADELQKQLTSATRKLEKLAVRAKAKTESDHTNFQKKALFELARSVFEKVSSTQGRKMHLALVATTLEDLNEKLSSIKNRLKDGGDKLTEMTDIRGVYFSTQSIATQGKTAFLFPGQGSQKVNMLKTLSLYFPEIKEQFQSSASLLEGKLNRSLDSYVYPVPVFTQEERLKQDKELNDTRIAQPAIGVVDLAMQKVANSLGLTPDLVAGHSYGEYVALSCANAISASDLIELSYERGRILGQEQDGDNGAMVAVMAPLDVVRKMTESVKGVQIANINAPEQCIVSGATSAIEEFTKLASEKGCYVKRVPVSAAFHSPLMEKKAQELKVALDNFTFKEPTIPVYSNTTAGVYPVRPNEIAKLLVEHTVKPVLFTSQLEAMYEAGARTFIEIGPGQVLTSLLENTFKNKKVLAVALDAQSKEDSTCIAPFLTALARLWAAGHALKLERLFEGRQEVLGQSVFDAQELKMPYRIDSCNVTKVGESPASQKTSPRKQEIQKMETKPVIPQSPLPMSNKNNNQNTLNNALKAANQPVSIPQPTVSNIAPVSFEQSGPLERMILEYQKNMMDMTKTMLDAQKDVMLAYLASQKGGVPTATYAPALMPSVAAQIHTQAPVQSHSQLQPQLQPQPQSDLEANTEALSNSDTGVETSEATSSELDTEGLTASLLEIISERTGYPSEMLEPNLDLEADLGIDSIKRIEIFNSFRKLLPLEIQKDLEGNLEQLAGLKTLEAISNWIANLKTAPVKSTETVTEAAPKAFAGESVSGPKYLSEIKRGLVTVVEDKTYSASAKSITYAKSALLVCDDTEFGAVLEKKLKAQGVKVQSVRLDQIDRLKDGTYLPEWTFFLPGANAEANRTELALLALAKWFESALKDIQVDKKPVLTVATAMNGRFGENPGLDVVKNAENLALQGILAGMTNTIGRELGNQIASLYIDIDPTDDKKSQADTFIARTAQATEANGEFGFKSGKHYKLEVTPSELEEGISDLDLNANSMVLVTGGARGITAEIAIELSKRYGCHLVLVGRAQKPGAEPALTQGLFSTKEIKAALIESAKNSGKSVNIAEIEHQYQQIIKDREIRDNLASLEKYAASVRYHSLDVRDEAQFSELIGSIYDFHGNIDGVIHGAGVIEDSFIANKTEESFKRVVDTKIKPVLTLIKKLRFQTLSFLHLFSSVVGRTGNPGQIDYVAANEGLNKLARLIDRNTSAKVSSLMWGPWRGGMAQVELEDLFASHGWAMIDPVEGRQAYMSDLMYAPKGEVEVMLVGYLKDGTDKDRSYKAGEAAGPVLNPSVITQSEPGVKIANFTIERSEHIYLEDHKLDSLPVLPMAVAVDVMFECAQLARPEQQVRSLSDFDIPSGVVFEIDEKKFQVLVKEKDAISSSIIIESAGKTKRLHHRTTAEYAEIQLPGDISYTYNPCSIEDGERSVPTPEFIYSNYLFHGPLFQGIKELDKISPKGVAGKIRGARPHEALLHPQKDAWMVDPILFDCAMQLGGVWARHYADILCLPTGFKRMTLLRPCPSYEAFAHVTPRGNGMENNEIVCDLAIYDTDGKLSIYVEGLAGIGSKSFNRFATAQGAKK